MEFTVEGEIIFWRGPEPFYFLTVPDDLVGLLAELSNAATAGWGTIPATVRIGETQWETTVTPREDGYLVPVKAVVRRIEQVDEGDTVTYGMHIDW
ncbi:DUF1905 domain-containing protein [Propionibacteriaceae bacterium Y2011]